MNKSHTLMRASLLVAMAVLVSLVALQPVIAEQSSAPLAQSAVATPRPAGQANVTSRPAAITIRPITGTAAIKSYKTTVSMKLDGRSAGNVAKGDFNADLQADLANKRQSIGLNGSLVTTLLARYLQGMPVSGLNVYLVNSRLYVVAQALFLRVCAVPTAHVAGLDQLSRGLSAEALLAQFTGDDNIYGTLVGNETINGIPTWRYRLDVQTINALARQRGATARLTSGDVWVAARGNYIVRLVVQGTGNVAANAGVDFNGTFNLTLNVSDVNRIPAIQLPSQCNTPMRLPA